MYKLKKQCVCFVPQFEGFRDFRRIFQIGSLLSPCFVGSYEISIWHPMSLPFPDANQRLDDVLASLKVEGTFKLIVRNTFLDVDQAAPGHTLELLFSLMGDLPLHPKRSLSRCRT